METEIKTQDQYRRTVEAFAETDRLIAKLEDSPNPDLELIKRYEQNAINLGGMIYRWRRLNGVATRCGRQQVRTQSSAAILPGANNLF